MQTEHTCMSVKNTPTHDHVTFNVPTPKVENARICRCSSGFVEVCVCVCEHVNTNSRHPCEENECINIGSSYSKISSQD